MSFIILDRDGVINYDSTEYIKTPDEWHPIPGSLESIAKLSQAGYKILIATNQSGIARGYFTLATLQTIHQKLINSVEAHGGHIQDIFFCPHHPDEGCICRKPLPGLLQQIEAKYPLNLADTFFIGDSEADISAAQAAGCRPLLVLTGNGEKTLAKQPDIQFPYFPDLARAVDYVLSR